MNLGAETEVLEFKKTTGELREGIVSLGSMLNKNGYGTLYFGVRDNGDVLGQQIGDRTLREVSQAIANFLKPQVIPAITLELLEEKNVVKVYVEGIDTPYAAYGKYYMRSADEDRELSPEQLRVLMFKKAETDSISKNESVRQDLKFGQLRTIFATKGLTVNDRHFEENAGLKLENGRYNFMAGLLADENDVSIKVVTFRGKDKSEVIKRNEYGYKCLLLSMDQVLSYMESVNETKVQIGAHQRQEEKSFDILCFREAWVNACLHTRWEKMNPPAVYIFSDRIEIISTGGIPEDLTKEEFFRGISRPVNIRLRKIFGQLGYVEQTGHGIPLIVNHYGRQAFEVMRNYVNATIPLNKGFEECPYVLNDAQERVYMMLKEHPDYTIKQLVSETQMSDGYVRKILQYLKAHNYTERVGSNKTGYWKVNG